MNVIEDPIKIITKLKISDRKGSNSVSQSETEGGGLFSVRAGKINSLVLGNCRNSFPQVVRSEIEN